MTILPSICLCGAMFCQVAAPPAAPPTPAPPGKPLALADFALASESQKHMGTEFTVQFYHSKNDNPKPAMAAVFAKIAALDNMMSDYAPDSELSRLSASAPHASPVAVSEDLYKILKQGAEVSELTDGAFDVTVGPLTKLWRQARRRKELPDAAKLQGALAAVDWKSVKLSVQTDPGAKPVNGAPVKNIYFVQLAKPNMRLDLGGIAQGYAVDKAIELLSEHGFDRTMVNASGDIRVGYPPPDKEGWRIGLTGLKPKTEAPTKFITLKQPAAISTSGDAFQFVEVGGKRYSHIVDPKTGMGLTTPMSVTVIAPTCTMADAYASALCVMGPEQAKKSEGHWNRSGYTFSLFVIQSGDEVETIDFSGFKSWYDRPATPK